MPRAESQAASGDRARVYRALARVFYAQDGPSLQELRANDLPELGRALARLGAGPSVAEAARELVALFAGADPERLRQGYQDTFEASGGLRCSPHETSHTADTPQEGLTRTFEMADVAGFYHAFGVGVTPGSERPDHVAAELEFMHLLAVKEAIEHGEDDGEEHAEVCRDAARAFLRDHLGRWTQRFAERLEEDAADPAYAAAGRLLERFVALDATWLGAS
jgi:TorA maturation chaperone TorD